MGEVSPEERTFALITLCHGAVLQRRSDLQQAGHAYASQGVVVAKLLWLWTPCTYASPRQKRDCGCATRELLLLALELLKLLAHRPHLLVISLNRASRFPQQRLEHGPPLLFPTRLLLFPSSMHVDGQAAHADDTCCRPNASHTGSALWAGAARRAQDPVVRKRGFRGRSDRSRGATVHRDTHLSDQQSA